MCREMSLDRGLKRVQRILMVAAKHPYFLDIREKVWYCWCCKGDDTMAKRAKGTGTLRKRTDGRWEGRLYLGKDENGKNQYKTVTSKKKSECQNKLDKLIAEEEKRKRNENFKYGDCVNPTVEEWNRIYIEDFCTGYLKPKTISGYKSMIKNYINPYLGKYHLRDLSKLICQQYIMDIYENGRINQKKPVTLLKV